MFNASQLTASGKILQNVSEIASNMKFALNELRLYCELFRICHNQSYYYHLT